MHGVPGGEASHDGDLIEHAGQTFEQSDGKLEVIREAADVEVARRPRAFLGVEAVNLAHSAFDIDEQHLPRRAHRFYYFLGADVERAEGVEIAADQGAAADAQQFTPRKHWYFAFVVFHGLTLLRE